MPVKTYTYEATIKISVKANSAAEAKEEAQNTLNSLRSEECSGFVTTKVYGGSLKPFRRALRGASTGL